MPEQKKKMVSNQHKGKSRVDERAGGRRRTESMLELVATDKAEHLHVSALVCADDREARIGVACRVKSCELVAQGAHCVRMSDIDDFDFTIHLWNNKNLLVSARGKGQKARAYGIADGEATPYVLVLRVQVRELGKPIYFFP